jgi:peptidoglycan/xylan/chitin deacetylase (PgdA/CDA1 family)
MVRLSQITRGSDRWPILMYHAVEHADGLPQSEDYTVSAQHFAAHLEALRQVGARSFPVASLLAGAVQPPAGPGPWVLLTFDDGFESVLTQAAPLMHQAGLEAGLLFITAGRLDQPGYLSQQQVRALLGMGLVVGAHGLTHRYLTDLPLDQLRRELIEPRRALEDLVGYPVRTLSAPGGRIDQRVMEEAWRAGYTTLYGSQPGLVDASHSRRGVLPRFAVTASSSPQELAALAQGDWRLALRLRLRYEALRVPKKVLGNQGYDALRGALLASLRRRRGGS